jgi:hypothetical protein
MLYKIIINKKKLNPSMTTNLSIANSRKRRILIPKNNVFEERVSKKRININDYIFSIRDSFIRRFS